MKSRFAICLVTLAICASAFGGRSYPNDPAVQKILTKYEIAMARPGADWRLAGQCMLEIYTVRINTDEKIAAACIVLQQGRTIRAADDPNDPANAGTVESALQCSAMEKHFAPKVYKTLKNTGLFIGGVDGVTALDVWTAVDGLEDWFSANYRGLNLNEVRWYPDTRRDYAAIGILLPVDVRNGYDAIETVRLQLLESYGSDPETKRLLTENERTHSVSTFWKMLNKVDELENRKSEILDLRDW